MTKRSFALIGAALLSVALVGCVPNQGTESDPAKEKSTVNGWFSETDVHLSDGRSVHCLFWEGDSRGGLSCDWANAE